MLDITKKAIINATKRVFFAHLYFLYKFKNILKCEFIVLFLEKNNNT